MHALSARHSSLDPFIALQSVEANDVAGNLCARIQKSLTVKMPSYNHGPINGTRPAGENFEAQSNFLPKIATSIPPTKTIVPLSPEGRSYPNTIYKGGPTPKI